MKKLLVLMLLAVPVWAQQVNEVTVRPFIFTATIDSIRMIAGSKTIIAASPTQKFASVVVGQTVWGAGIPYGTVVTALADTAKDSIITISKAPVTTDTSGNAPIGRGIINVSYYQASGGFVNDFIGLPFEISSSGGKVLSSVTLIDSSDCADDSLEIILFDNPDYDTSPVLDTAQVSTEEGDYDNLVGTVLFTKMRDVGAVRILQEVNLNLPMPVGKVYGRLVNRSSTRVLAASTQAFILKFRFTN